SAVASRPRKSSARTVWRPAGRAPVSTVTAKRPNPSVDPATLSGCPPGPASKVTSTAVKGWKWAPMTVREAAPVDVGTGQAGLRAIDAGERGWPPAGSPNGPARRTPTSAATAATVRRSPLRNDLPLSLVLALGLVLLALERQGLELLLLCLALQRQGLEFLVFLSLHRRR